MTESKFTESGSPADREKRKETAAFILNRLQDKQDTSTDLSKKNAGNFTASINDILSNRDMREFCAKDPGLAEHITEDILNFITESQEKIQSGRAPFENERDRIADFEQAMNNSFEEAWKITSPFISENYKEQQLDPEFYHNEFLKSMAPQINNQNSISLDNVRERFTEKWGDLLFNKRLKWELEIIEEERKKFCDEIYKKIEEIKKLRELIDPFVGELGRLWDMSSGRWKKINFYILKRYADYLERDPSLQKLAELLGRMRHGETEYEDEIYMEEVIVPVWKEDYAAKAELIGVYHSDDISSMIPSDAALLADDTTQQLFSKKFADKKLQTFEYQAKILSWEKAEIQKTRRKEKDEKKGPIIICIDTSASMHGTPEMIAKTFCFALLKTAFRDKRKCFLISFSTAVETLNLTDIENNLEKLADFLSMSFEGGTDAVPALHEALKMLETEDYEKADVIMVSDFVLPGFDEKTKIQLIAAKQNKTKFHSLAIGKSANNEAINEFDNNWMYDTDSKIIEQVHYL